ncbi:MAG: MFS transporter, partial [Pseudomonadales bacterium]|nr:MFS transporter [Pseudomonadales bacterium]
MSHSKRGLRRLPLFAPLADRNFRLFWLGTMISALGTQLTLIAFPWLVLKITGDALIMGTVIAVSAIPRAVFMIVGGAFTDRFSSRTVLLWVNWLRTLLMIGLALLVFMQWVPIWLIYFIALLFGLIDAFQWPASSAILPRLLPPESLPAGNSLVQGVGQLSLMIGPALAGLLIALFAAEATADMADLPGIALVFFIDG